MAELMSDSCSDKGLELIDADDSWGDLCIMLYNLCRMFDEWS